MNKLVIVLVLLMSVLSPVIAEDAKTKTDSESKQTDAYYQDFVEFMKITGAVKNQKIAIQSMFAQFQQSGMDIDASKMELLMTEELNSLNQKLFPVYKKYISHEDLKTIIAFYKTEAGRRLVQNQPIIMQESMAIGAEWGRSIAERMQE